MWRVFYHSLTSLILDGVRSSSQISVARLRAGGCTGLEALQDTIGHCLATTHSTELTRMLRAIAQFDVKH